MMKIIICLLLISLTSVKVSFSQGNYDFKTPGVDLLERLNGMPDPFQKKDGTRVEAEMEWKNQREYIILMLEHFQYGKMPPSPENILIEETLSEDILNGTATRKLYLLTIEENGTSIELKFGLIKPIGNGPFPVIIKNDREINDIPEEVNRTAIERGYVMAQFQRMDLASDIAGHRKLEENRNNGAFLLYPDYNWGTIAVWAWGYKLLIDYFETVDFIDSSKIVATGHSRGGKAAYCAGIFDERIAITAPNSSGLGGTASHRYFELGKREQTIGMHITSHAHWWTSNYYDLAGFENMTPFDAHFGKVTIAPRAFFNAHALQDYHANPFGTHIAHKAAKKVYRWLGVENNIAMHWRTGGHAQGVIDWLALLDFSDQYFFEKEVNSRFDIDPYPTVRLPIFWNNPNIDN
ncbi:MAG: hypothetical protein JJU13_03685 [Balneolaceae bacterium]|nr:hypothetical protein [Balneolaceae bacterium]